MRSFICVFSVLLHSLSPGLWWCIAECFFIQSGCISILYIKAYISSLSVHIYFLLILESNTSLLPFTSNFAKLKKDTDPEFCISFCNKPCCRGAQFLPCLVWPGTPQSGFWSLWSSQNLSYVQNLHRGVLNDGYFSFCFPFPISSMYSLLLDSISQNLGKTRNKNNMGKAGGNLLSSVSGGTHRLKKKCYNVVVLW